MSQTFHLQSSGLNAQFDWAIVQDIVLEQVIGNNWQLTTDPDQAANWPNPTADGSSNVFFLDSTTGYNLNVRIPFSAGENILVSWNGSLVILYSLTEPKTP